VDYCVAGYGRVDVDGPSVLVDYCVAGLLRLARVILAQRSIDVAGLLVVLIFCEIKKGSYMYYLGQDPGSSPGCRGPVLPW
jgi:hypothetical protein